MLKSVLEPLPAAAATGRPKRTSDTRRRVDARVNFNPPANAPNTSWRPRNAPTRTAGVITKSAACIWPLPTSALWRRSPDWAIARSCCRFCMPASGATPSEQPDFCAIIRNSAAGDPRPYCDRGFQPVCDSATASVPKPLVQGSAVAPSFAAHRCSDFALGRVPLCVPGQRIGARTPQPFALLVEPCVKGLVVGVVEAGQQVPGIEQGFRAQRGHRCEVEGHTIGPPHRRAGVEGAVAGFAPQAGGDAPERRARQLEAQRRHAADVCAGSACAIVGGVKRAGCERQGRHAMLG